MLAIREQASERKRERVAEFCVCNQSTGIGAETDVVLGSTVTTVRITVLRLVSNTSSKVGRSHPGSPARELLAREITPSTVLLIVKLQEENKLCKFDISACLYSTSLFDANIEYIYM